VVNRTLREFNAIYAAHYPNEGNLQLPHVGDVLADPDGKDSDGLDTAVTASAQEQAQQLKILRVLRFMVLPEMTQRLLGN
jgi:hypothetical protein